MGELRLASVFTDQMGPATRERVVRSCVEAHQEPDFENVFEETRLLVDICVGDRWKANGSRSTRGLVWRGGWDLWPAELTMGRYPHQTNTGIMILCLPNTPPPDLEDLLTIEANQRVR